MRSGRVLVVVELEDVDKVARDGRGDSDASALRIESECVVHGPVTKAANTELSTAHNVVHRCGELSQGKAKVRHRLVSIGKVSLARISAD